MRLDISLKQIQKLTMTTELRQSIEILLYNHFELVDYLMKESEENPTLDVEIGSLDLDYYPRRSSSKSNNNYDTEEDNDYEKFISREETLYDYVFEQLISTNLTKEERRIGEFLLGMMDENGYITGDFYSLSNKYKLSFEKIMKVLKIMQDFYPTGICSTSLSECLYRQAKENNFDDLTRSIIKEDLVYLAENRVELLAKKYEVSNNEVQKSFDKIRSLNPRPGQFLSSDSNPTKFIIPDVILEIIDGKLFISLNEESFIKVSHNNFYKNMLDNNIDMEAKEFLKEKFKSTNWIIKSIQQRRETILKVATAICDVQKEYFLNNSHLLPMTMSDIAKKIDVHESTVSRTVNGKYIQTSNKIIELKEFFKGGFESKDGDVSAEEIKLYIKTAIESEDKKKPLSDQKITDNLNNLGYKISRRTVAKYRDSLGIFSTSKRKRF